MAEAAPPEELTPVTEVAAEAPSGELTAQAEESPEAVPSPPAEETPPAPEATPEPPRQRTWNDVVDDYNNNRPLFPREVDAINAAREQQRVAAENARKEDERVAKLFPSKRDEIVKELATWAGVTDLDSTDGLALQYKFDKHWEELTKEARQAFTTPMLKTAGTQLWDALGRSREAHAAIQSLSPDKLIPFAIEVGRNLGATSPDVAPEAEVAKWQDGGKLDPKKFITVEQAEARLNKALDVERRARGTVPPPVGGGRTTVASNQSLTLEAAKNLPIGELIELRKRQRAAG